MREPGDWVRGYAKPALSGAKASLNKDVSVYLAPLSSLTVMVGEPLVI